MGSRKIEHRVEPALVREPDYKEIKKRFLALNSARLQRTYDDLRNTQRNFLELLPLLYHVNHPILPGYVSKNTPAGLPDYTVPQHVITGSHKQFKSFAYKRRAYRKFDISAIYLMGSTGSIAYATDSDFDIWICYNNKLGKKQYDELKSKTELIEKWARSQGVVCSLFLVDPEKISRGEIDELSQESSGSAFHYLLLDEFYRTSLLLAGRYPAWWLVPPDDEPAYDERVADFHKQRFIHAKEHISFGGLSKIPAEEFYGATIWALYKGIHAPYKSILKILLMQVYAHHYPNTELLGLKFKRAIYNNKIDINDLDPYIMMLNHVEEFLIETNQDERLDLLRRSFYFKVNQKLSIENTHHKSNWRAQIMSALTKKWNWNYGQLVMFDDRDDWKVNRVVNERAALIDEFSRSYNFLSNFSYDEVSGTARISSLDLNVLGRKLYAAFDRKAGKIEIVYRGITENLHESHISIHYTINTEGEASWLIFNKIVDIKDAPYHTPIKRSYDLIELIAWCYFNKIINKHTVIAVYAPDSDLSEKEIKHIISSMEKLFPQTVLDNATLDDYNRVATIRAVGTFINLGVDPFARHTKRGTQITSNRTDALRFGGLWDNLAISFEQVIVTSWQEVLTYHYHGIKGLMNCLRDYIQWAPPSVQLRPPNINAFSYSSYRGPIIAKRIESLFEGIINFFYRKDKHIAKRYILGVEWDYYVLQIENDNLNFFQAGTMEGLIDYLSRSQTHYIDTAFDAESDRDTDLVLLYAMNRPGLVQCFYRTSGSRMYLYFLDENGSLNYAETDNIDFPTLISQLQQFFAAVQQRIDMINPQRRAKPIESNIQFNRIYTVEGKRRQIEQFVINRKSAVGNYISIKVSGDMVNEEAVFTIYCNNTEFSSYQYGADLYKTVAKYIFSLRRSQQQYPIYITDIELSRSLLGDDVNHVQTFHYLSYKNLIEKRLNDASKNLT